MDHVLRELEAYASGISTVLDDVRDDIFLALLIISLVEDDLPVADSSHLRLALSGANAKLQGLKKQTSLRPAAYLVR